MTTSLYKKALVHGNFEILHTGHLRLFTYARSIAERLIVGLNIAEIPDFEISRRRNILLENSLVDDVVNFVQVETLIEQVKPDVLVKGLEHSKDTLDEKLLNKVNGGRTVYASGEDTLEQPTELNKIFDSSSGTLEQIQGFLSRNKLHKSELVSIIERFKNLRTLVVGDVIVDEYIECNVIGLSQETASVVCRPINSRKFLGGAGIVAGHCAALGSETHLLTLIGEDEITREVENLVSSHQIVPSFVEDKLHQSILKQRFVSGNRSLFRLNHFRKDGLRKDVQEKVLERFEALLESIDLCIFSDFAYGLLDFELSQKMIELASRKDIFMSADSQSSSQTGSLSKFKGVNVIYPTEHEARLEIKEPEGLIVLIQKLNRLVGSQLCFLKLGAEGLLIQGRSLKVEHIPALNKYPRDISGAGDSLIAASSLSLRLGAKPSAAGLIGSIAAAIQVSRQGNIPISGSQILDQVFNLNVG